MSKLVTGGNYTFTDSDGVTELWVNYPNVGVMVGLPSLSANQGREIIVKANEDFDYPDNIYVYPKPGDELEHGHGGVWIHGKYGFYKFKAGDKWTLIDGFDEFDNQQLDYQGHAIYSKVVDYNAYDTDETYTGSHSFTRYFSSVEYYGIETIFYEPLSGTSNIPFAATIYNYDTTHVAVKAYQAKGTYQILVIGRWYENPTTDLDTSGFYRVLANGGYRMTSDGFSRIA